MHFGIKELNSLEKKEFDSLFSINNFIISEKLNTTKFIIEKKDNVLKFYKKNYKEITLIDQLLSKYYYNIIQSFNNLDINNIKENYFYTFYYFYSNKQIGRAHV